MLETLPSSLKALSVSIAASVLLFMFIGIGFWMYGEIFGPRKKIRIKDLKDLLSNSKGWKLRRVKNDFGVTVYGERGHVHFTYSTKNSSENCEIVIEELDHQDVIHVRQDTNSPEKERQNPMQEFLPLVRQICLKT